MNINQVIEKSREYHGSLSSTIKLRSEYFSKNDGYMCVIGCNLENPSALEEFAETNDVYGIHEVVKLAQSNAEILKEPLIREAVNNDDFLNQLSDLQYIHDTSGCIVNYLEGLEQFEKSLKERNV